MKKTLNINIAGYPFIIDEDAYQILRDYLDTIQYAFESKEDTSELAGDIEGRIAELLLQNESGGIRIVTREEISQVIDRIGQPSDFMEVEETVEDKSENGRNNQQINMEADVEEETFTPPYESQRNNRNSFGRKNLFRDPQNAMLGGVCSGIAQYLNIDPTIVRLVTVLLFFLSASTVAIVYIILWIVVPEARTPLQRMKMMGKDPTFENIGRTVTETYQEGRGEMNNGIKNRSGFAGFLSSAFSIFVKCLIILCLIIGLPVLLAIFLVLVACIIAFFASGSALVGAGVFNDTFNFQAPGGGVLAFYLLLAAIGAIITIGIPFWLLFRMALRKKGNNLSDNNRRSVLIIWLIGIALVAVFTVKTVKKARTIENYYSREKVIENLEIEETGIKIEDNSGNTLIIDDNGLKIQKSNGQQEKDTVLEMSSESEVRIDTKTSGE